MIVWVSANHLAVAALMPLTYSTPSPVMGSGTVTAIVKTPLASVIAAVELLGAEAPLALMASAVQV